MTGTGTVTTLYSFDYEDGFLQTLIPGVDGELYGTIDEYVFSLTPLSEPVPKPSIAKVVSGASFQPSTIPATSWITIIGSNFSVKTSTWAGAIVDGKLPTSLEGVGVNLGGRAAYIYYVSPSQINVLAPDLLPGSGTVGVEVFTPNGIASASLTANGPQPAFFQWGTYAVATRRDYSLAVKNGTFQATTTVPSKPGEVIILWGNGFGRTTPSAPTGVVVPSITTYNTASPVTVTVGGATATVYGAALAPGYAGLYQIAIQIPTSLSDGDYPIIATISGQKSPSTTLITVRR